MLEEARIAGDYFDESLIIDTDCIPMCTEILRAPESVQDSESTEDLRTFHDVIVSTSIPVVNDYWEELVSSSCTGDQSNSHLTKEERELLQSCENDSAFRGQNGRMKWAEVAVKFASMADDVTVFPRTNKRLQSSLKSLKEITKKRITLSAPSNQTPIISTASEVAEEPLLTAPSLAAHLITSTMPPFYSNNVSQVDNTTIVSSTGTRTKRNDNLDALERLFVQDFGKNCIKHNTTVESDKLALSYHRKFPSYRRDAQTLKNCWINYRRTPAYSRFINEEN